MAKSLAELQRVSKNTAPRCSFWFYLPQGALSLSPSFQALAGEVGMSSELDDVARALFNGQIPGIWRRLAPDTLKTLGNWIIFFGARYNQYTSWVSVSRQVFVYYAMEIGAESVNMQ